MLFINFHDKLFVNLVAAGKIKSRDEGGVKYQKEVRH